MSLIVPANPDGVKLALATEAHAAGSPLPAWSYRHVPIEPEAVVVSLIGLTADNLPVGFALGRIDEDQPRTVVVVGEPRDPILAARAGRRLADLLDPLLAPAAAGGPLPQLLFDSPGTVDALDAWSLRLRSPALFGPYRDDPASVEDAQRCRHAFAMIRALTSAALIPDTDVIVNAVDALSGHLTFPLGGHQETRQLPVLLTCLWCAGAAIDAPVIPQLARGDELLDMIEKAEQETVSAATDPRWDNRVLFPALHRFKTIRNAAAGGDPLRRIDPVICADAARASGLDLAVTTALVRRHQTIAAAFRLLRAIPELPGLRGRREQARPHAADLLNRAVQRETGWADFVPLAISGPNGRVRADLTVAAAIVAARNDSRVFAALAEAGQAATGRVTSVSADGRSVELTFAFPIRARTGNDWWWLDDPREDAPITGDLDLAPGGGSGRLTVTAQMRRLAADPVLLRGRDVRLTSLARPFGGRPWRPRRDLPAAQPRPTTVAAPDGQPRRWATPVDFTALGE